MLVRARSGNYYTDSKRGFVGDRCYCFGARCDHDKHDYSCADRLMLYREADTMQLARRVGRVKASAFLTTTDAAITFSTAEAEDLAARLHAATREQREHDGEVFTIECGENMMNLCGTPVEGKSGLLSAPPEAFAAVASELVMLASDIFPWSRNKEVDHTWTSPWRTEIVPVELAITSLSEAMVRERVILAAAA